VASLAGWMDPNQKRAHSLRAQLMLNALWTPIFFRWHEIGWALAVIVAMELLILATILNASPTSRTAALLLLPYALGLASPQRSMQPCGS
jgi:tryptophan-rich sensory protein